MKNLFFPFLFLIISASAYGQGMKRKMADNYFNVSDYAKAAPIYDEISAKTLKSGQNQDWEAVRKAAESNRLSGNYIKAESWYSELVKSGSATDADLLRYIDVLRYNGKYDLAAQHIETAYARNPGNRELQEYHANKDLVAQLRADSLRHTIAEAEFNYGLGDYAPAFYKNGLVYASRKRNSGFVNRKFLWDDSFFADLYFVPLKDEKKRIFKSRGTIMTKPFKSKPHDGPVAFSKTGDFAVITRNNMVKHGKNEVVKLALYRVARDENGKWEKEEPFEFNSKSYSTGHATLSADGKTMYFASDMEGGKGGSDIYRSRLIDDRWTAPENLGDAVNSAGNELFPFVAENGKLFFASDGHPGMGGLDIFEAAGENGSFTAVENMGYPMNTSRDDFALIVDSTGEAGYFSSNRKDNVDRIYKVTIKFPEFMLNGDVVSDDGKNTPLGGTEIEVKNMTTGETEKLVAAADGTFSTRLKRNSEYKVTALRKAFSMDEATVSTEGKTSSETLSAHLVISALLIDLKAIVLDKATRTPLTNAKIKLTDKTSGKTTDLQSDAAGTIQATIDRGHDYVIQSQKSGYLNVMEPFDTRDKTAAVKEMELLMPKIVKGDVFTVNDVYYDYGKYTLREESKAELDKLFLFLENNPNITVELSSHTDSRSGAAFNQKLSQKRAQSCVDYLIGKGIRKDRIKAKGYGESRLLNRCKDGVDCSEEEHQLNRRTEIKILQVN